MDRQLTSVEARILGCLVEKEATTPDVYPLSLNALRTACNQRSNRDPVMDLSEEVLLDAIEALKQLQLVRRHHGSGARVEKYVHGLDRRLDLDPEELALIAVLLLRGPQTPGELRQRSQRLCSFASPADVEAVLERLRTREKGALVARLPKQPGKREARYAHLLCGPVEGAASVSSRREAPDRVRVTRVAGAPLEVPASPAPASAPETDEYSRVYALEREVRELRRRIEALEKRLGRESA